MASKEPDAAADPWDPKTKRTFDSKRPGEYFDPCQEAASRSLKCLHRNGGDKEMCADYFQAYRDCKKQWIEKRAEEKRTGRASSWFGGSKS